MLLSRHPEFWNKMNCQTLNVFFRINFFTWRAHFKELKLKGNLLVRLQIWKVASLTYKQQNRVCEFSLSKYFFSETNLHLNMARRRHVFFSALGQETEKQIKLAKNKISFDL